ncbi:hypothetical protein AAFC00_004408 [Neodothiora populina]|uniref:Uncharacterized protein n=1 Tax=Neodothiora populina TaxID=2781224 RepID=A0ABR3PPH6_9PEZI
MQIHRLLSRTDPHSLPDLLHVSNVMLETVIQFVNSRDKPVFLPRDLSTIVLAYGLPCGSILIRALKHAALPSGISRSRLIRNVSVFTAHLETICGPQETNHVFCVHASGELSRNLDEALEAAEIPSTSMANTESQVVVDIPATSTSFGATDQGEALPIVGLETAQSGFLADFNLTEWDANVDWSGTGLEWNIF